MPERLLTRRSMLGAIGGLAVAGILGGCGEVSTYPANWDEIRANGNRPSRGGVLRYGLSTEPVNFEPHVSSGAASDVIRQLTYSALLMYDENGELMGDLAEEFGWDSPQIYKIKLRRNVQFHDGSTLTAEDVVFSFDRIMNPDTAASAASLFSNVKSVQAAGRDGIIFELHEPNNAFEFALADAAARIVSKKWVESGIDTKLNVMGTGPFRFQRRVPGVSIVLEGFDSYYIPELPYLNGIEFTPMADDYTRVTALRTASVDMIDYVPSTHVQVIQNNPQLQMYSDSAFGFGLLGFVTSRPPFDDKRVRQAVAHSIDREAALQTAFLGQGQEMTGGLMPDVIAPYARELDGSVGYDPDRVRWLLKEAGQQGFTLETITTSSYSVISRPAEAMLPAVRAAGVSPILRRQEWLSFQDTVTAKTYPSFVWGTALKYGHPAALGEVLQSGSRWAKFMDFKDEKVDNLLKQARTSANPELANELYFEVEKRILDEMPLTYTLRRIQGEAAYKYVRGYYHPPKGAWTQVSLRQVWLEERR